jgi:hypothetical protein
MIFSPKGTYRFFPGSELFAIIGAGAGAEVADEPSDFLFVFSLIVITVEYFIYFHNVGQRPGRFCEIQHFPFDFGQWNVLSLRFRDDPADEKLFRVTRSSERLHRPILANRRRFGRVMAWLWACRPYRTPARRRICRALVSASPHHPPRRFADHPARCICARRAAPARRSRP